jgi:hypothetical protein
MSLNLMQMLVDDVDSVEWVAGRFRLRPLRRVAGHLPKTQLWRSSR